MSGRSAIPLIPFSEWTTSQRELWPLQSLEADGASLNSGEYTELLGELDVDALCARRARLLPNEKPYGFRF